MRKILTVVLCFILTGGSGYLAYRGYKAWKHEHFMSMARDFYAKADNKNALLSLRQAYLANPKNADAARLTADVLQAGRSREALLWRSLVVELNPNSVDDRLALAQTAITFHDYEAATNALAGVSDSAKGTVKYQNMAGSVSALLNLMPDAKEHFLEAARLDPNDPVLQLNLSVVDLRGSNTVAIANARATLEKLSVNSTNANLRCQALRELVIDAMRSKHTDSALALTKDLLQQTNALFTDRLLRLEVLRGTGSADFQPSMRSVEQEASANSANLYELATWQQSHREEREGLAWLESLSPGVRTNQPAALLIAEFHLTLKDWPGLQQCLINQNWAGSEFVRHAFLARALRGQNLLDSSKAEWEYALTAASGQKTSRIMLLRLSASWGWRDETEDILWTIVNQNPGETWANPVLEQLLFVGGRTQGLLSLFSQENKARPSDLMSLNNLAMTALLLNADEYKPNDLARELYEKSPTNASYASTYAFSLLVQKKNAQALSIIEKLKPADLERPSIVGYYGMILEANGDRAKAKKYLELATKSRHLPEEQKLFDKAMSGV
jgi:Flp pilus assembly protein TadD